MTEKKGDILNQLAVISDLMEKINANIQSRTVVMELSQMEFQNVFEAIQKKSNSLVQQPGDSFAIKIGEVDFVFNTNNA